MSRDDEVYALSTSATAGGRLRFRLPGDVPVPVRVRDAVTGRAVAAAKARGPVWTLDIPPDWPSSLYAAAFDDEDVYFAVRPARPAAPILVPVPFLTWQAYNRSGVPGEGLYPTEGPQRAGRVGFDRSGGGPAGFWEAPFHAWLARRGYRADYCSNLDLHDGSVRLDDYRLVVCPGHDEYWSAPMRDAAEAYVARGGNIAFFGANTCWWQVRLEDGGRTLVCHRDALNDPITPTDPGAATVEWSSAPVRRPENHLTGVSFRRGAGCWENMAAMRREAYTVCFADHWAFAGTGLRDGDAFAAGAIGYETDAADFTPYDGVPLATGADGTPADFVILATADLRHWRDYGQGGYATMGVMRRGRGTVFNAATIGWTGALDDPVVDRITRNVLDRLGGPGPDWEPMGRCDGVTAVTVCEHRLFAARADGTLATRPNRTQNLPWRTLETTPPGLIALAAPREAVTGCPVRLLGLFADGSVRARLPVPEPAPWTDLYRAPAGAVAVAPVHDLLYAATGDGVLWRRPLAAGPARWSVVGSGVGSGPRLRDLANLYGRLLAVAEDGRLLTKPPERDEWAGLGRAPELITITATAGRLVGATREGMLVWRDVAGADADPWRDECADTSFADAAASS